MTNIEQFQKFLDKHDIRHFSALEVFFRGGRDSTLRLNTEPPKLIWDNIIPTLTVLDRLRRDLHRPVRLLSIYRSPAYNKAIGGVCYSQHIEFTACDITVKLTSPITVYSLLKKYRKEGLSEGGLGHYSGFVHIDTRGSNATWSGSGVSI